MASRGIFVVFALPVILSVALASAVMADVLEKPGRELNMWPQSVPHGGNGHDGAGDAGAMDDHNEINFVGLSDSHRAGEPLTVRVSVSDPAFDCGDLYITVYSDEQQVVSQDAFFGQCFVSGGPALPHGEFFIDSPGSYVVAAEMVSGESEISVSEVVTVE